MDSEEKEKEKNSLFFFLSKKYENINKTLVEP